MPEPTFITRADTLLTAQLAGWPEVPLGRVTAGPGEAAWREIIGRSAPADRAQLGQSLPPVPPAALLVGEGHRRLLEFYERHGGTPPPTPDRAHLDRAVIYVGDLPIRRVVVDVLARLPAAVVDLVLRHVWILGVGRDAGGWCATAPPLPAHGPDDEALTLLLIAGHHGDAVVATTTAHGVAHAWLEPSPRVADVRPPGERLDNLVTLVRLAEDWNLPVPADPFNRPAERERKVASLMACWGYQEDAAGCARAAVRLLTNEIAHRLDLDRAARPEEEP